MQEETYTKLYAKLPYYLLISLCGRERVLYTQEISRKIKEIASKHRCREGKKEKKKTTFLRNKFTSGSDSKRHGLLSTFYSGVSVVKGFLLLNYFQHLLCFRIYENNKELESANPE